MVFKPPGAAQTPKTTDFQPNPKPSSAKPPSGNCRRQLQTARDAVRSALAPSAPPVARALRPSAPAGRRAGTPGGRGRIERDELLAPHEEGEDHRRRRLASDWHEGVPTNVSAASAAIEEEWHHDYSILKPVLEARGYDTASASRLCELPRVFCNYGYRRRVPIYSETLMGDWVGREYQLLLGIARDTLPAVVDQRLFAVARCRRVSSACRGCLSSS